MKELFSSIYLDASNRMKSPILGTFVLCWLAYNHIWVAEFVLAANNAERLSHIKASSVSFWSDAFFPLLMASAYVFGVPFIQWGVDKAKYRLIDKRRLSTHHSQLSERYTSQARVSELKSKATLEYWQELHKNHAENAAQQIINLKAQVSSKMEQIRALEVQNRNSESNYSMLMQSNETLNSELTYFREEAGTLKKQLNTEMMNAQHWQSAIEEAVGKIESSEPNKLTVKLIQDYSMKANNMIASTIEKILTFQEIRQSPYLNEQVIMLKSDIRKLTDSIFEDLKNKLNVEQEFSNGLYKDLKNAENPERKTDGFVVDTSRFNS